VSNTLSLSGVLNRTTLNLVSSFATLGPSDAVTMENNQTIVMTAAQSGFSFPFGPVTSATFVYIQTTAMNTGNGNVTVALNGSGQTYTVNPMLILFGAGVTSITLTNPDGVNPVTVQVYVAQ
jgi:hypothetical protein